MTKIKYLTEGIIEIDPWGSWDDVDKGFYINIENLGLQKVDDLLRDFKGKKVRLTIEILDLN